VTKITLNIPPPRKGGFKGAKGYGAINKVMKAMAMGAR